MIGVGALGLFCMPDQHVGVLYIDGQCQAWFPGSRDDMARGTTFHMVGQSLESMKVEVDGSGKAKPVLRAGGWYAQEEFSLTQGQTNWYYQEWTGTKYRDMSFDGQKHWWKGSQPLCIIGPNWMHPDQYEPARKWISPVAGTLVVSGNVRDLDPKAGDGVIVRILKNSEELWSRDIANGDTKGYAYYLEVPVQTGDAICFRVSQKKNSSNDTTEVNPTISLKGTFDNGYAGFGSVYFDKASGEILAFYHAEDHQGLEGTATLGAAPYYASVGLAVSKDGGRTFEKMGQVLTSSRPKAPSTPDGAQGVGCPTVVADPSGQYLYMYFGDWSREPEADGINLARSRIQDAGRPGTWYKYYHGGFTEPGLGGRASSVVVRRMPGDWCCFPSVSFNSHLNQYLMVYVASDGFWMRTSGDGITWSAPTQVLTSATGWSGAGISLYPAIVGEDDTHTWQENWLYYGFTPRALTEECHHMVRQRITFSH